MAKDELQSAQDKAEKLREKIRAERHKRLAALQGAQSKQTVETVNAEVARLEAGRYR